MRASILATAGHMPSSNDGNSDAEEVAQMKLLRYGPVGNERPGLLDRDGRIRDLAGHVPDITAEAIAPASVQMLRSLNTEALPLVHGDPRLAVPVARVGKCIAIGLNYTDHAKEADLSIPIEPVVFSKAIISSPETS
jgi:2,4-diketo-3-deoxy-L-fuconate hydrolase